MEHWAKVPVELKTTLPVPPTTETVIEICSKLPSAVTLLMLKVTPPTMETGIALALMTSTRCSSWSKYPADCAYENSLRESMIIGSHKALRIFLQIDSHLECFNTCLLPSLLMTRIGVVGLILIISGTTSLYMSRRQPR